MAEKKQQKEDQSIFKDESLLTVGGDSPITGMNKDISPNIQPDQSYRFALNAVNETSEGENVYLSNEGGMKKIKLFKEYDPPYFVLELEDCAAEKSDYHFKSDDEEEIYNILQGKVDSIKQKIVEYKVNDTKTFKELKAVVKDYVSTIRSKKSLDRYEVELVCCDCSCDITLKSIEGKSLVGDLSLKDIEIADNVITFKNGMFVHPDYPVVMTFEMSGCCDIEAVRLFNPDGVANARGVNVVENGSEFTITINFGSIEHNNYIITDTPYGSGIAFDFYIYTNEGMCPYSMVSEELTNGQFTAENCCDD